MTRTSLSLAAGLAAIALAAAGYTVFWHSFAGNVLDDIRDWSAEREADGWTVNLGAVTTGGFPFSLTVRAGAVRLAGPASASRWQWDAPGITATARIWDPDRIMVNAPGVHRMAFDNGRFVAEPAGAEAVLTWGRDGIDAAEWTLSAPTFTGPGGWIASARAIRGRMATLAPDDGAGPGSARAGYGFAVVIEAPELPGSLRLPPGGAGDRLSAEGSVRNLPEFEGTLRGWLEAWREAGGVIELQSVAVDRGASRVAGSGTFALDRHLQPEGAMTVEVAGIDGIIESLAGAKAISGLQALALRAALALGTGGKPRLPISLQERQLSLGPLPVFKLAPIRWE